MPGNKKAVRYRRGGPQPGDGGGNRRRPGQPEIQGGVWRMLTELHLPFDFLDLEDDFSPYQVLILPDQVTLGPKGAEK